jgi:hypothetical protein
MRRDRELRLEELPPVNTLQANADKTIRAANAAGMSDAAILRLIAQIIVRLERRTTCTRWEMVELLKRLLDH